MPQSQLTLPQQFGRFLISGALVFGFVFWGLSQILIPTQDAHIDLQATRLILKAATHQPFSDWLQSVEAYYIPFFLGQRALLGCYIIAATLGWFAAFFQDIKVLRKENTL
ncbi:MAG TPA: hypothetical protein VFB79_10035 [Candidatus Angelobacter sp.]|nr:hypothetical protein [Candidatus Angelobacter sp.]